MSVECNSGNGITLRKNLKIKPNSLHNRFNSCTLIVDTPVSRTFSLEVLVLKAKHTPALTDYKKSKKLDVATSYLFI